VLERGGCNFSHVTGAQAAAVGRGAPARHRRARLGSDGRVAGAASAQSLRADGAHERALLQPPATEDGTPVWWFGGGMDLTPYYGNADDARHFHRSCRDALAPFGDELHPRFKQWCDEYFYLKHRKEARGVGGIFFDDFNERRFDDQLRDGAKRGRRFPGRLPADPAGAQGHALRRTRTRFPGLPARPLRRIQPRVRPRHPVRPAVGRAHRGDPDVDAADREMALRLAPGRRHARSGAVHCDFLPHRDWLA
jgi:hypothetical protein